MDVYGERFELKLKSQRPVAKEFGLSRTEYQILKPRSKPIHQLRPHRDPVSDFLVDFRSEDLMPIATLRHP